MFLFSFYHSVIIILFSLLYGLAEKSTNFVTYYFFGLITKVELTVDGVFVLQFPTKSSPTKRGVVGVHSSSTRMFSLGSQCINSTLSLRKDSLSSLSSCSLLEGSCSSLPSISLSSIFRSRMTYLVWEITTASESFTAWYSDRKFNFLFFYQRYRDSQKLLLNFRQTVFAFPVTKVSI